MGAVYSSGFDAHTHLDFPAFDADRSEVCARARVAGVQGWVVAAADPAHWGRVLAVARDTAGVAMVGVHPWWAGQVDEERALASLPEGHGIGEIGLDRLRGDWARQQPLLRAQLALARDRDVPVALHCVKAWPELYGLLRRDGLPRVGGMVHAWAGPTQLLQPYLDLGLHISLGPQVLGSRAPKQHHAAVAIPADRLLIETDCPESPLPGQGRAEPADLVRVARAIAELRGSEVGEVLALTGANARRLLL